MSYFLEGQRLSEKRPFTHPTTGIQYPRNWLRLSTADEKAATGITWEDDPIPEPPARDLTAEKWRRIADCDAKTREIILRGFHINGDLFSTSEAAQQNLLAMEIKRLGGNMTLPFAWSTTDGGYVMIDAVEQWAALLSAAISHIEGAKVQGLQLRAIIAAAENLDALDAVKDNRA